MKIMTGILISIIIFSGCALNKGYLGGENSIPSIGLGIEATREKAIDNALREAINISLGVFISSETIVEKAIVIQDKIISYGYAPLKLHQ